MFNLGVIRVLLFIDTIIIVCTLYVLCIVFIRPLSKKVYKRVKGFATDMGISFLWEILFSRIKIQLKTDTQTYELLGNESAILISNHQHALDHMIVLLVNQFFGSFANTMSLSKNSIKYYPVYGWISWLSSRVIFLERNWKHDALRLKAAFEIVKRRSYRPWWFVVFPEGTRLTPQKLVAARDYATSQSLHIPKNVLVPRTKGFVSIVKYSREYFQAVYDLTLVVPCGCLRPTLANVLKGEETTINIYIKRYSIKELPESDENVAAWCRQRFSDKDAFLEQYYMVEGAIDHTTQIISSSSSPTTLFNRKRIHVAVAWAIILLQVSLLMIYCTL